jgi:hypothetical protein
MSPCDNLDTQVVGSTLVPTILLRTHADTFSRPTSTNMSLEEYDAQIATLRAQLVDLGRRRNELVPICRLPQEVLFRIAKLSRGWDPAYESSSELNAWRNADLSADKCWRARGWESLFQTCTHMHRMHADAAELYSYIGPHTFKHNERLLKRSIARSGDRRLILDYDRITADGSSPQNVIEELLPRARAARLYPPTDLWGMSHPEIFHRAVQELGAPDLEELHLLSGASLADVCYEIDVTFLGHRSPALRILYLENGRLNETTPGLPTLQRLHLIACSADGPQLVGLWRILASAAHLEHLEVSDFKIMDGRRVVDTLLDSTHPPLQLPNLKTLMMSQARGHLAMVHLILRRLPDPLQRLEIRLSGTCQVHLRQELDYRVRSFWKLRSGETALGQDVRFTVRDGEVVVRGDLARPLVQLHYRFFISCPADYQLLDEVTTLRLLWMHAVEGEISGRLPAPAQMPRLRNIIFTTHRPTTTNDIATFEPWLDTLITSLARPLEAITFEDCPASVDTLMERLKHSPTLVNQVVVVPDMTSGMYRVQHGLREPFY